MAEMASCRLPRNLVERDCCPGCGASESQTIVREGFDTPALRQFFAHQYEGRADLKSLEGFSYHIVRCGGCGLGYQRTVPGDRLLHEIYEHWIPPSEKERLHRQYSLSHFSYLAEQVQFLVRHFGVYPHAIRVFDFGMGWGEWASVARAFGCQVTGSELSPARIQHAQSIGIEVIDWKEIPNRKFHFINTEQVFEHLLEPLATLRPLVSAMEDNGILKISVPDSRKALRSLEKRHSFGALSSAHAVPVAPLEHVNCFEYRSLVAMARKAGLRPIRPSLRLLYNSSAGWLNPKQALRLALRPIYRHWFPKSTFVYFVKA